MKCNLFRRHPVPQHIRSAKGNFSKQWRAEKRGGGGMWVEHNCMFCRTIVVKLSAPRDQEKQPGAGQITLLSREEANCPPPAHGQ